MDRMLHTKWNNEKELVKSVHVGLESSTSGVAYLFSTVKTVGQEIDFKEILDEIKRNVGGLNGVEINVNIRNEVPFLSHKRHMYLVLNNLISNSIRHRNAGTQKPFVYVKIHSHKIGTTILVRDNSMQEKRDLLKIFGMLNNGLWYTPEFGTDLHVVRETIQKLNGRIEVESGIEMETQFKIQLPHLFQ